MSNTVDFVDAEGKIFEVYREGDKVVVDHFDRHEALVLDWGKLRELRALLMTIL